MYCIGERNHPISLGWGIIIEKYGIPPKITEEIKCSFDEVLPTSNDRHLPRREVEGVFYDKGVD